MCVHSLIWDDLEDQVVQQCELLSYLQGRVALKRLGLTVLHCLINRHKNTHRDTQWKAFSQLKHTSFLQDTQSFQEVFFFNIYTEKGFCNLPLTICVISSRVTWLSPGSSWVRVLHAKIRKVPLFYSFVHNCHDLNRRKWISLVWKYPTWPRTAGIHFSFSPVWVTGTFGFSFTGWYFSAALLQVG